MSEIAYRWSGILLVAGAALLGIAIVIIALKPVMNTVFSPGISRLMLLASIFLLLSLPAMYARQADAAGWLGLAGHTLLANRDSPAGAPGCNPHLLSCAPDTLW